MTHQYLIDVDGVVTDQFPDFRDVVSASVYDCGRPFKAIAADLDMSSSALSRKLKTSPDDPVHFPLDRLPDLLDATRDLRPIFWLIERYLQDTTARQAQDLARVERLLNELQPLVTRLGGDAPEGVRRARSATVTRLGGDQVGTP